MTSVIKIVVLLVNYFQNYVSIFRKYSPKLVMAQLCLRDRHPWMRVWCDSNRKLECSFLYVLARQQMTVEESRSLWLFSPKLQLCHLQRRCKKRFLTIFCYFYVSFYLKKRWDGGAMPALIRACRLHFFHMDNKLTPAVGCSCHRYRRRWSDISRRQLWMRRLYQIWLLHEYYPVLIWD